MGIQQFVFHQHKRIKCIQRQVKFFQVLLPGFTLQRTEQELVFLVVLDNKLYTAVAEIADTVEEHNFFIICKTHGIK